MTRQEFNTQMNRLVSVYSEKSYPPERMQIIWREMRNVAAHEFENIVSELIGSCSYAPMIDKFRDARATLFSKNSCQYSIDLDRWKAAQPDCPYCDKRGYVTAKHRKTSVPYAFGCKCDVSRRLYPKFPMWSNAIYLTEYEPEFRKVTLPRQEVSIAPIDPGKLLGGIDGVPCEAGNG